MAIRYAFRPGEKLNEIELAKRFGVSRTPLREALGRLHTEGFLRFTAGEGFYSRDLDPKEIFDLYEMRKVIELNGLRLAVNRARDTEIKALEKFLNDTTPKSGARTARELVRRDDTFHERLMEMNGNRELLRVLRNVNERIQFVKWIAMESSQHPQFQEEHHTILKALHSRDEQTAVNTLEKHISHCSEAILGSIEKGIVHIYMGGAKNRSDDIR
jgi:DNA-binding GntR family transcriptional regulator